ncbi:MAG: hypothetical protein ACXVEF_29685 [Polyangiales bacterium]
MRKIALFLALFLLAPITANAQEIQLNGPLAGAPGGPSHAPTRTWAIGGHFAAGDPRGVGMLVRVRPDARLAFDLIGEALRHEDTTTLPATLRLVGYQRLSREHDFLLALGPTMHFTKGENHHGTGFEAALGLEAILGWWTLRSELTGFVVDDHGTRTQGVLVRLGLLNVFGTRVYRE